MIYKMLDCIEVLILQMVAIFIINHSYDWINRDHLICIELRQDKTGDIKGVDFIGFRVFDLIEKM